MSVLKVWDGSAWQNAVAGGTAVMELIRAERVAALSLATGASTKIDWDTVNEAVGFSTTPVSDVVVPTAGLYLVLAYVAVNAAGTTTSYTVTIGGTQTVALSRIGGAPLAPLITGGARLLRYNAGDTVAVTLYHNGGAGIQTCAGPSSLKTELQLRRVGP